MIPYKNIFDYYDKWANYTYDRALYYIKYLSVEQKSTIADCMEKVGIKDKMMAGDSVEHLKAHEGRTMISFSEAFRKCISDGYLTPAMYFVHLCEQCDVECKRGNMTNEKKILELGRGLRSFPSFLRELDLAAKLDKAAKDKGIDMNVEYNDDAETDMRDHFDITISHNGYKIYVWSYMSTNRGVTYTYKRFLGKRGKLSPGLHCLIPFDMKQAEKKKEWYLYPESIVTQAIDIIAYSKPKNYQDLINKYNPDIVKNLLYFEV